MSQLVGDRVGEHYPVVLIDAAGLLGLAHPTHIGQAQGPAERIKTDACLDF